MGVDNHTMIYQCPDCKEWFEEEEFEGVEEDEKRENEKPWDYSHDNEDEEDEKDIELPSSVVIPYSDLEKYNEDISFLDLNDPADEDEVVDILSDYLSDTYYFCHRGFEYTVNDDNSINVYDIDWDTEN